MMFLGFYRGCCCWCCCCLFLCSLGLIRCLGKCQRLWERGGIRGVFVGVNLFYVVLLDGLLGYLELVIVFVVLDILGCSFWVFWIVRGDGVYEVGVVVGCGVNVIVEDGEVCFGGVVEQEVEEFFLFGFVRYVCDEIGVLEGEIEVEVIYFLKSVGEVDGDGGGLLVGIEGGCVRGSSGVGDGSCCCEECFGEVYFGWVLGGEMVGVIIRIVVFWGEGDFLWFYI